MHWYVCQSQLGHLIWDEESIFFMRDNEERERDRDKVINVTRTQCHPSVTP